MVGLSLACMGIPRIRSLFCHLHCHSIWILHLVSTLMMIWTLDYHCFILLGLGGGGIWRMCYFSCFWCDYLKWLCVQCWWDDHRWEHLSHLDQGRLALLYHSAQLYWLFPHQYSFDLNSVQITCQLVWLNLKLWWYSSQYLLNLRRMTGNWMRMKIMIDCLITNKTSNLLI